MNFVSGVDDCVFYVGRVENIDDCVVMFYGDDIVFIVQFVNSIYSGVCGVGDVGVVEFDMGCQIFGSCQLYEEFVLVGIGNGDLVICLGV